MKFYNSMKKVTITTGTDSDFFMRGRLISRAADAGETFEQELILTFEDFEDLRKLIAPARLNLLRSIMKEPGTIRDISERLNRRVTAAAAEVLGIVEGCCLPPPLQGIAAQDRQLLQQVLQGDPQRYA